MSPGGSCYPQGMDGEDGSPLATSVPPSTGAPPAIDALPATGDPKPWDGRKKVPR